MLETHFRQAATLLLEGAIRIAPPDTRDWGLAMRGELNHVEAPWAAVVWALGGASVLARRALAALLLPGRHGQGIPPEPGLFAEDASMRRAMLITGGGCILAALLLLAAPPFRQALRVAISPWARVVHLNSSNGQPRLVALARRAEQQRDPEALAFCAVRLKDAPASVRLANEAVGLDSDLFWVYAVVAVRHPELPEISQWLPQLERRYPQNALFPLISAESIDIEHVINASKLSPKEEQQQLEGDPAWQSAMAAAFRSAKFDDYLDRLQELDRRVVLRYHFYDAEEVLFGGEDGIPTYSFWDSSRFASALIRSGQNLEATGDWKGAGEKYWAVAHYGQMIDSQGHAGSEHWAGTSLQAMAYKQLKTLSEKGREPCGIRAFWLSDGKIRPCRPRAEDRGRGMDLRVGYLQTQCLGIADRRARDADLLRASGGYGADPDCGKLPCGGRSPERQASGDFRRLD